MSSELIPNEANALKAQETFELLKATNRKPHASFRLALMALRKLFHDANFESNTLGGDDAVSISLEKDGVAYDLRLMRADKVTYVSSAPANVVVEEQAEKKEGETDKEPENRWKGMGLSSNDPRVPKYTPKQMRLSEIFEDCTYVVSVMASAGYTLSPYWVPVPRVIPSDKPETWALGKMVSALALLAREVKESKAAGLLKSQDEMREALLLELNETLQQRSISQEVEGGGAPKALPKPEVSRCPSCDQPYGTARNPAYCEHCAYPLSGESCSGINYVNQPYYRRKPRS